MWAQSYGSTLADDESPSANRMAGLPKTDSKKRAVRRQVGRQHAFLFRKDENLGEEIILERTMPFDEDLSVQCGLEELSLGDDLDVPEDGRGAKSKAKILRLVMTPTAGCELLRRLREDPSISDVPVIVLTR